MFKKAIATLMFLLVFVPAVSFAATDWGVSVGGGNWGFSIGSGNGRGGSGGWGAAMSNLSATGLPQGSILGIIENIMNWLLAILGIAGVIGFAISGIIYLLSAGNEGAIEKAKEAMKWSIVGVIVGISGIVIIQAINMALNANPNF